MAKSTDQTIEQALQERTAKNDELPDGTEIQSVGGKFIGVIWKGISAAHQSTPLDTRAAAVQWISDNYTV